MEIAQGFISTRRGSIFLGVGAAVLALILLLAYLNNYRNSVGGSAAPATVLVAKSLIQKGSPGNIIASSGQFQVTSLPKGELKDGAFADPQALKGRVALSDIYPGQQLTESDFALTSPDILTSRITADQRAISIPVDQAHGMIGQIQAGDHVDVLVGLNVRTILGNKQVVKLLLKDAVVLRMPSSNASGIVTLRAPEQYAVKLAYAADNGKIWLVLRPASGARTVSPGAVTAESVISGKVGGP